jgi:glucose-1-phosphate thymidylyltransferase
MKALILAAGYATRLYPLTKEYPKSLLKVNRRPIIDYIVDKLEEVPAVDEIIVVTNSKFVRLFKEWEKRLKSTKPISIVDDLTKDNATRRGAIGDMDFVVRKKKLRSDLLVIGGDNLFDESLDGFLSLARALPGSPVIGVYDVNDLEHAKRYGIARLDKKNKVIEFQEKPERPRSTLAAMCLYHFPKERLGLIRRYILSKTGKHDASGWYIDWLSRKEAVYAYVFGGRWYDIGDHKFYNKAKRTFTTKEG